MFWQRSMKYELRKCIHFEKCTNFPSHSVTDPKGSMATKMLKLKEKVHIWLLVGAQVPEVQVNGDKAKNIIGTDGIEQKHNWFIT